MGGKKKAVEIPQGNAQKGQELFKSQCGNCHAMTGDGKGSAAPPLNGVVGRKSASTQFAYSKAMKKSGLTWTRENLFEYIKAPMKLVPGNAMSFGGIPEPELRADIIAYLETTN